MRPFLVLLLLSLVGAPTHAAEDFTPDPRLKIDVWLEGQLLHAGTDSFLVRFDGSPDMAKALAGRHGGRQVYDTLRARARARQAGVRAQLEAAGIPWKPLWIIDALEVRGDLALARALAERPEVVALVGNPVVRGLEDAQEIKGLAADLAPAPEWGVARVNADDVWLADGVRGAGVVVASADSGVDWTHLAIKERYRGGIGTAAVHDYNWHDAIDDLPAPFDDSGHGTHTVGTMVGDHGSNQVGVAPSAQWIACRNMDHGFGTPATYLDCMQWFIAPYPHGGDPEQDGDPTRAPHIVNNSWGCLPSEGCDVGSLLDGLAATRAAGILFVAAAGNSGPTCSSVNDPPGMQADAFSVGATDPNNNLANFSSRGPVTLDGSNRLKPDIAAPGVFVRSTVPGGGYAYGDGTSMASPHVSGVAALLWSAKPQLRGHVAITRCLLASSANATILAIDQTCGGTTRLDHPNHLFGWGLVDAYNAIHYGPDSDIDGIADPCDCAANDGGAIEAPGEVVALAHNSDDLLGWSSLTAEAGSGTVYDLLRGDLVGLRAGDPVELAACLATGLTSNAFSDSSTPASGEGYYYLVQGRNGCGLGGYGTDSAGRSRLHTPCP